MAILELIHATEAAIAGRTRESEIKQRPFVVVVAEASSSSRRARRRSLPSPARSDRSPSRRSPAAMIRSAFALVAAQILD